MSRALDDWWYHHLRVDPSMLTSRGYRWDYDYQNSLGSGAIDVVGFTTGVQAVAFMRLGVRTTGARGASFAMYSGGTIGLGAPVQGYPANHDRPQPNPLASIEDTEIVTTPGTLIASGLIDGSLGGSIGDVGPPIMVLAANKFYYLEIENLDNQTATLTVDLSFAALSGWEPGG